MEFILIIGIFEALFLAGLVFTQKEKSLSDNILGAFFLLYALNFALSYIEFYNRQHGFPYPAFINTAPPFILLHGPVLWFYIKSLTDQHFKFRPIYGLHFFPFLIMLLVLWIDIYSLPVQQKIELIASETITDFLTYKIFVIAIAISTMGYFYWGFTMVQRYKRKIKTYFSHIENIDLSWLQALLVAALILYGIVNSAYIVDFFYPIAPFGMLQFLSFVFGAVYIVFLGFFGLRQGNLFATQKLNLDLENAVKKPSDQDSLPEKERKFIYTLQDYMEEHKPYLNSDLTINKLSKELDVTPEYLSRIINKQLNKNFFDFINTYRVEEFKRMCKDEKNENFTLISIAYDSGFNSKATFNRVFKNITGITPGAYYKNVSGK
jgi:AraC-like DNA-binding protein